MNKSYTSDLCTELQSFITSADHKESECKQFLTHARDILVKATPSRYIDQESEYRGHTGDSDYLVVCATLDEAGQQCIEAYVWEAKAPQCFLFEPDTKTRVRPTKEFVSAENQLLHYFEDLQSSEQFREEFNITHHENIKLGGIIIGSRNRLVKSTTYSASQTTRLFIRALNLRKRLLYGQSGIKVMTWDDILDYLKGGPPAKRRPVKQGRVSITITGTLNVVTSDD